MPTPSLAVVLPSREGFAPEAAGAIALCVRDFAIHSRYRSQITVYGTAATEGFPGIAYHGLSGKLPFHRSHTAQYLHRLKRLFHASPPSLIEVQNRPTLALALARRWPVALHLHNDPQVIRGAATPAERRHLLRRLRGVFCVSEFIRRRFMEGLDDTEGKVSVIPNGLALPASLPAKENLILYAGRLAATKGALEFARALESALPSLPGWRGVTIGADRHAPDGKATVYEREVAGILARLERSGQAEWHGYLPHEATLGWFARAAIAVVPSVWAEAFGRTALEAMAHGCALVTSGRGGLAEVVGSAAVIAEPEPAALAAAIGALAGDQAMRASLGRAARKQAATFAIEAMTKRLDECRAACMNTA